jgi:hypothetical protein
MAAAVAALGAIAIVPARSGRVAAADTDITIEYDKQFSFAGLRTWAWHPDGAVDVRLALTADDDPERVAARIEPVIVPATEKQLASRKLTRVPPDQAHLFVHYYALLALKDWSQFQGQFLSIPEWGLPPFAPSTTAISVYPVGSIVVDLTVPGREGVIWRGAARRKVNFENSDRQRREVIENAIRDIFKEFPPRK